MFIPTNAVCYGNANFFSTRNGKELPIPSSPTASARWLLFPQVPKRGQRQRPIALPCPSRLCPASQLRRPCSSRRWPPWCTRRPFRSLSRAGCGPAAVRWMDLEMISVTGRLALAERRHFWLAGLLTVPYGRGEAPGWLSMAGKRSVPAAPPPPPEPLPCGSRAALPCSPRPQPS